MNSRTDLLSTLREATRGDLWLTTYALYSLCTDVDLGTLIGLVESVLDASEARAVTPTPLTKLLEERWGITR
jgi:hypothetical protein